ncbi:MAG: TRAP transporter large permease subunit [Rubrivivax sp.]|nr:TRAP transporter large permease subunit [Rubrivivax sp.]
MKIRKELWFGFVLMGLLIAGTGVMLLAADKITSGHLGLMMLALVVVAIMLGFPTAFTLMGMGMIFTWLAYGRDSGKTLTLMVQSAFKVMGNDVLISIPLFVFMGYLVERANLIEKLFKSLHLALARVPGSLAVATIFTCAVFATATGIVGAVVTLMGLLALPQMLRGGYDVRVAAGSITAGGCLGILIPPSVMLIVYGATAGVSVVQLYAGAFFPGLMLAGLYVVYVIVLAKLKPHLMPPLSAEQRFVLLPPATQRVAEGVSAHALAGTLGALRRPDLGVPRAHLWRLIGMAALPLLVVASAATLAWHFNTRPVEAAAAADATLERMGTGSAAATSGEEGGLKEPGASEGGLKEPGAAEGGLKEPAAAEGGLKEPGAADGGVKEPPGADAGVREPPGADTGVKEPPGAAGGVQEPPGATGGAQEPPGVAAAAPAAPQAEASRSAPTRGFWIGLGAGALALAVFYALLSFQRLEIFRMLLQSFFPLVVLILAVLGSIVFGLTTPTEAAAVGAFGGYLLAAIYATVAKRKDKAKVFAIWLLLWAPALICVGWFGLHQGGLIETAVSQAFGMLAILGVALWALLAYRQAGLQNEVKESVFLTAKTSAMVCWLFVGSAIFSAAFALLGGQELVEKWVMSMNLTKTEFLILSQVIIFILGWPLEWTEIIVIFMPIFIPLLDNFGVDPLFFGLLVALNLQTAFLSPPVAMAAFYLKGVSPPHVTLNQIFAGMLPFMGIQIIAIILLYQFPAIGLWLPEVLYK